MAVVVAALYLVRCRAKVCQRNRQTWGALLVRLSPGWNASAGAALADAARGANMPEKLWSAYRNARVMQEIADFALRNFSQVDRKLVATLHQDATRIRFRALAALARYAFSRTDKNSV
jgi:hypothetical protein